jgi:hypothetical protein
MKTAVGAAILLGLAAPCIMAQAPMSSDKPQVVQVAPPSANLDSIITQVQQATSSTSTNIGHLHIDKWKTDSDQKQQLQQIAGALQRNIANAVPELISDVQTSKGGVLASFKLYHNLNVVYENLSYLADVAGSLGKKEEFEPLATDAASLESARSNLSTYIEQTATKLETAFVQLTAAQGRQTAPSTTSKVVVIDDDQPQKKTAKPAAKTTKKKASPGPAPTPTPVQSGGSPH